MRDEDKRYDENAVGAALKSAALLVDQIDDLKQQLWLLLGDVKARAVSCACDPPLTKSERYHIERAEALLAGYEPKGMR